MLFPFVELVFTHGLGPAAGRYVVRDPHAPSPPAAGTPSVVGRLLDPGSADVLVVRVDGAPPGRRSIGPRRPAPVASDAQPLDVPLYVATLVFGTRAFPDDAAAQQALATWRDDVTVARGLAGEALAVLNRAVRAYRAAAADPYVGEVVDGDPRTVRVGYGGPAVIDGEWIAALDLPPLRGPRVARAEQLRPVGLVADVLAGRSSILDGEDVLLRAVLDLEQGRPAVAAAQLVLALELLGTEPGLPAERLEALAAQARDASARLAVPELAGEARDELAAAMAAAGDLIDRWHAC